MRSIVCGSRIAGPSKKRAISVSSSSRLPYLISVQACKTYLQLFEIALNRFLWVQERIDPRGKGTSDLPHTRM